MVAGKKSFLFIYLIFNINFNIIFNVDILNKKQQTTMTSSVATLDRQQYNQV